MSTLDRIALAAAARYKRRCWWASFEDLVQQARLAVVEAERTYDPQTGVPFEGYAWRAAINQLHALILRESAPVSAPGHKLPDLKGLYRQMLDEGVVDSNTDPYAVLIALERERQVACAIDGALAGSLDEEIARSVLLQECRPRHVARAHGIPVRQVYRAVHAARTRIGNSYECWRAWKEDER